jgi:outer membrane biosynthesis protein TonB
MMVKDLRPSKSSAINGNRTHQEYWVGRYGMFGEISGPLILSVLIHAIALGGLFVVAAYVSAPTLSLPPAQMVRLVDLPSGGGGGDSTAVRETPPPAPKKPDPPPESPRAEKPPEAMAPEPTLEKTEQAPPPKPQEPPREPEMTLPTPKAKEPPKKEPPKREEKKPEPASRAVAEKPPEKKREAPPPAQTPPAAAPRREATARGQPERSGPGGGGRPGPGSGPGSSLTLGGGGGMLSLDSANFPFTYYLRQVTGRIEENWVRPQQSLGRVVIYFRIKRDGTIVEPQIYESSRNQAVDLLASGAIKRSEPFPPLPTEFGGDYLGIYLCFGLGGTCPGQKEG